MSTIDRIRYYDGEFLRAFDFDDEQTYHIEMRRRLNRYLHLAGIAQGLNLVGSVDTAGVTIMPGLAIDAFGREIYVFAPYTLGDSDVIANRITRPGTYDVWLHYRKSPGTPPASGYDNCNQTNQYTRWVESFSVALLSSSLPSAPAPGFADTDTDDPSQDRVGVLLGTVFADPTSSTAVFANPLFDPKRCTLLGVIAQTIQTPASWSANQTGPPFSFLNAAGAANVPLSPPASLEIVPNVFANQNLIVGSDFVLTTSGAATVNIQPEPAKKDDRGGNVKIAGDLFVQGNIYNLMPGSPPSQPPSALDPPAGTNLWLGMGAYVAALVQQSMPDFVAAQPVQIVVPNPAKAGSPYSVTAPAITIPSKLSAMSGVVASAAISGIQLNANVTFGSPVGIFITSVSGAPGANLCTVSVTYTVTGDFAANAVPSILTFNLTATAVCFPK